MKKQNKILFAVVAVLVIGAFVYFSTDSTLFQGRLSHTARETRAFTLVDSADLDGDFDGVTFPTDQCPDAPAHQVVRFGPKDYTTYLGQKIKLDQVSNDLSLGFDVNGESYGVEQNGSTYVHPASLRYPGFEIKYLFSQYTSRGTGDEAIVVISRTDYNSGTGCSS